MPQLYGCPNKTWTRYAKVKVLFFMEDRSFQKTAASQMKRSSDHKSLAPRYISRTRNLQKKNEVERE